MVIPRCDVGGVLVPNSRAQGLAGNLAKCETCQEYASTRSQDGFLGLAAVCQISAGTIAGLEVLNSFLQYHIFCSPNRILVSAFRFFLK